jgi:RimJ/RimL family protein N-acetyltransferase
MLPDRLAGPRVALRRWLPSDEPALSAAISRNIEHLRPWMPWIASEPLPTDERVALIEAWERVWLDGGDVVLGVFLDDHAIGGCGMHRRRGPHGLELGYWIDAEHTNRGLATEVARTLTTAALSVPSVTFVEIHHDKANVASRRVPEHLGYTFVGEAPDEVTSPGEIGIDCAWRMDAVSWGAA